MITGQDLKKEIVRLLKSKYDYMVYGKEVTEGYKKPSFFVDLRLLSQEDESVNIVSKSFHCTITYFQKKTSESDILKTLESILGVLTLQHPRSKKKKLMLKVGERYLPVSNFEQGFTGKNNNIMTIDFDVEFYDFSTVKEDIETMKDVIINKKLEG
ncbi:hypothetical protein NIA71_01305 [Ihubacter massiliensis]|uniref:phage tail terminator family protein n=1 Tax=Ihubacter massiliensis TaxID=1852367 RepID=UPI002096BFFC|nr:hypothetical protein [Ihubacter massiliensis]MCI7301320.1 hypothetical protein [Clostridia bacterium]MCO7120592.1 hypothetical protein [Ihubacter massiliensis]MDY3010600.1 hypothetical protein [Clostridiales Family XIII bacterium]